MSLGRVSIISCFFSLWPWLVVAATEPDDIPPLRPPRGPIPPSLWEQYGFWIITGAVLVLLLLAAVIWLVLRPRPAAVKPPVVQAREALGSLRQQPETGTLLSRVSHVVRSYFSAAFGLPQAEMTTSEFCDALKNAPDAGPELYRHVSCFLRECDERKFAPAPPSPPMGAVDHASKLVEAAEARRAGLSAAKADGRVAQVQPAQANSTGAEGAR